MHTPKVTPKDFFLWAAAMLALYISVFSLIALIFQYIDYAFPDALAGYFYANSVAWPISMLVVLIPLLYILEWLIKRDISKMPEKKEVWIRKWRIYLTLFLAGATVITDLIVLINTYLNGEITGRFAYKVLAVLIIAGAIFKYYILERMENWTRAKIWQKIIAWVGIIIVIAGIAGGFATVGSPATQRALRFDNQRVADLSNIQWQIINYWQTKQKLPTALTDLNDSISGFNIPVDPETQAPYEYSVKGVMGIQGAKSGLAFDLCATFSRASIDTKGRGGSYDSGGMTYPVLAPDMYPGSSNDSWKHDAGQVCFMRMIDPEKYPPNSATIPRKGI